MQCHASSSLHDFGDSGNSRAIEFGTLVSMSWDASLMFVTWVDWSSQSPHVVAYSESVSHNGAGDTDGFSIHEQHYEDPTAR